MKNFNHFSFMFLLGLGLKKVPTPLIQFFLTYSLKKMHTKYIRIFEKVGESNENSYLIIPTDVPFNFYLVIDKLAPSLTLVEKEDTTIEASATIKASLENLLQMFEGKLDGDAAFFSKDLIIEGSTAAIVALRNAVDGEDINIINDLSDNLGIFSKIVQKLCFWGVSSYNKINDSILLLQESLLNEYSNKTNRNIKEINSLKSELAELRSNLLHKE
ncbi:SCP2 domain-containing protein [Rickettsiales bacterium LUAb2]